MFYMFVFENSCKKEQNFSFFPLQQINYWLSGLFVLMHQMWMLFYLEFLGLRSKSNIKFYLATGNDLYMRPNIFTAVSGAASNSISQSPLNCAEVFYKLATSRRIIFNIYSAALPCSLCEQSAT